MRITIMLATALLLLPAESIAQEIELRGGAAIGSHKTTYAGLEFAPRPAVDLIVGYPFGLVRAFAGATYASYGCQNGLCRGQEVSVTGIHAMAGVEYRRWHAWARAGGSLGVVRVNGVSSTGPGVYAAMGATIEFGGIALRPGVTYRWMGDALAIGVSVGVAYER